MAQLQDLIERCENRTSFLGNKVLEVGKSMEAVKEHCSHARLSLDLYYEKMKIEVLKSLEDHYSILSEVIEKAKQEDLEQLGNLHNQLNVDLAKLDELLYKGKHKEEKDSTVFENGREANDKSNPNSLEEEISSALEQLSKSTPEIPCSSLSIVVDFDDSKVSSAIENVKNCLHVNILGGLQITECMEMPGGILIKWDEHEADSESVDTENSTVTNYTLQYASYAAEKQSNIEYDESSLVFNTLYTGEDTQFLMAEVEVNTSFYFRVCRSYSSGEYGPWSLTKRGWTTFPAHEWNRDDCANEAGLTAYELGNNNRTATKIFPESCKVLRSKSATYRLGLGINFKIDEAGERSSKDGIGLITKRFDKVSGELLIFSPDSIIVNTKGTIYVNGTGMVTMLPILKRGSVLSFHTNRISPEKLRVTISIEDKAVTFDWLTGSCDNEFSFAASFEHTGWQITVV